jgi:predicted nucleic acid-binding protein
LLDIISKGAAKGYVSGHAITTLHYIVERERGRAVATAVSDLLQVLEVVPLESADFQRALSLGLKDYEDAVHVAACLKVGATLLVTRNERDFKGAPVTPRSAAEALMVVMSSASRYGHRYSTRRATPPATPHTTSPPPASPARNSPPTSIR